MRKFYMAFLSTILAAGAVSLPLLASTTSAFAASPRTTAPIGTQLARLKAHAQPHAQPHGSVVSGVFFSPSSSVGGGSATWTIGLTTSASGALGSGTGTITIVAPTTTTFPSAAGDYSVNGTTVLVAPTTTAGTGTVRITTPVAVADSTAIPVVIVGVTNPAAASYLNTAFSVSTSADTAANPGSGQAFSVGSVNTTTGLGLSLTSVAYGSEASETFTVSVTGQVGEGYPEGTVAVYNSTTELCIATLTFVSSYSSSATCSLAATQLAPASYSDVFATYTPGIPSSNLGYTYTTSTSYPVQAFSVIKYSTETTTTSLKLSAAQVTYGDEQVEQLSVSVSPQYAGTTPTGTVTISGANCQITLSSGKGSCTLPLAYFNVGNRKMVATYLGSSNFRHSASATQTIVIVK